LRKLYVICGDPFLYGVAHLFNLDRIAYKEARKLKVIIYPLAIIKLGAKWRSVGTKKWWLEYWERERIMPAEFLYSTEIDLSIDNGPGISEREFVHVLLKHFGDQIICVVPYPKYPNNYFNSRINYVFPHKSQPARYPLFLVSLTLKICQLNRRHKFNALVFRLGMVPIVPLLVHKVLRIPMLLKTLAGYYFFEKGNRHWTRKLLATLTLPIYKAVLRRVCAADTVSIPYVDWLHFKFGISKDKLCVIPNGANTALFSPKNKNVCRTELGLDRFVKIVGYVGALDSLRHLDSLVRCTRDIQATGKQGLVLVGDGPEKTALRRLVVSLGLEKNVLFTGAIPYQDVPKYINSFDVAVDLSLVPMRVGDGMLYGSYSQKIPQYLSCGVPIIAWDVSDTQFLKKQKIGNVATVGDTGNMAQAIKGILSMNESEYTQLSTRARRYTETHFSTRALATERLAFWRSVLTSKESKK